MTDGPAGDSHRRHFWRIGRLACGVAAVIAVLAGVAAFASAQTTPPVPVTNNPELNVKCGLRVMLVLDESSSISDADVTRTRLAAGAFVSALRGTGSQLAIVSFAIGARTLADYREVSNGNSTYFANAIAAFATNVPFTGRAGTNWQDAFDQVRRVDATHSEPADLVVFVTDGNPNRTGTPTSMTSAAGTTNHGENEAGWTAAMPASITAANAVKGTAAQPRSRIFAMGVGAALNNADSQRRLQWISGQSEFGTPPPAHLNPNFATADWTRVQDFTALEEDLKGIVTELCGGSLTITKKALDPNGNLQVANGWEFTTTLESGGHTWTSPASAGVGREATLATGHDPAFPGFARFAWTLHTGVDHVMASVEEVLQNHFSRVVAECQTVRPGGTTVDPPDYNGIPGPVQLGRDDFRTCTVNNRQHAATLTVVKHLEPEDDPGRFNLHLGSHVIENVGAAPEGSLGPIPLPLGDHAVSESAGIQKNGTETDLTHYDTSISCVDLTDPDHPVVAHTPDAAELSVPLTYDGQDVMCTITNVSNRFGEITLIKHLLPAGDSGKFNLKINGVTELHFPTDGASSGPIRLPFGPHDVTEEAANGTNLAHYNVSTTCIDENAGEVVEHGHNAHGPRVSVDLSEQVNRIQCTITNERPGVKVGRLEVVKHLVPHDDAGAFKLLIGGTAFGVDVGHNGTTGPLEFALGRHTITEQGAHGTDLAQFSTSTTCVDKAHGGHTVAHNAHGPSVTVDLSDGDNIVCTITNTRILPPPEGGGDIPAPPGPNPHLAVFKTMPPRARVGQLVPITISVHNHGRGTAHGVQLAEKRPPGLRIVHVGNHGTIHNGTAVWHLGNLAHGQTRTVHATTRVLRTGSHVDTAVATARNADAALSVASVRARAARRRPPAPPPPIVTG
jgi:hypothetical protein